MTEPDDPTADGIVEIKVTLADTSAHQAVASDLLADGLAVYETPEPPRDAGGPDSWFDYVWIVATLPGVVHDVAWAVNKVLEVARRRGQHVEHLSVTARPSASLSTYLCRRCGERSYAPNYVPLATCRHAGCGGEVVQMEST